MDIGQTPRVANQTKCGNYPEKRDKRKVFPLLYMAPYFFFFETSDIGFFKRQDTKLGTDGKETGYRRERDWIQTDNRWKQKRN